MRVVVLGTGTAVGKTYVTQALARALRRSAPAAPLLAVKPIETGLSRLPDPTGPAPNGSDAAALEAASHLARAPRPHPLYGFVEPVSPHLAARRRGVRIQLSGLTRWLEDAERETATVCENSSATCSLVETAGGVFSPLGIAITNLDLARALEPAYWILVAPDALGVLHEMRATLLAMTHTARLPDAVVLSAARDPDASTGTNAAELAALGIVEPVAAIGRNDAPSLDPLLQRLLRY